MAPTLCTMRSRRDRRTAWYYVYMHRIPEIALPVGGEFAFPATADSFFKHLSTVQVDNPAGSVDAPSSADPEQEVTPADCQVATCSWVVRPSAVIRVHKVPRRLLDIPTPEDDPPAVPNSPAHVTRRTKADLERSGEASILDVWCGDVSETRALSDFWVARRGRHRWRSGDSVASARRPSDVWLEVWKLVNKKQKRASIVE